MSIEDVYKNIQIPNSVIKLCILNNNNIKPNNKLLWYLGKNLNINPHYCIFLNLSDTKIKNVSSLSNIHNLHLSCTKVTNVSNLGNVSMLCLLDTKINDVSNLNNVSILMICGTNVTDISMLKNVEQIYLSKDKKNICGVEDLLFKNIVGITFI